MADLFVPAGPVRSGLDRVPALLVGVLCVCLLVLLRLRADVPLGVRADSWSEANILVSARNVGLNGWRAYKGVAQHQVDRPPFKSDPFYLYAQYPLGGYYIAWMLFDPHDATPSRLRWPPALCAVATLICWYLLLCHIVGRWTALLSTLLLGSAYGFLAFADDLHHGYSLALVTGMMLAYVSAIASNGRMRTALMAVSWILLFINSFMSWEWYLWSQAFFWGHALLLGVPFRNRWLLVFALAPFIALGIQSGVRLAAFGPDPGNGMVHDILRRTIRLEETADTPPDVTLATYAGHVAKRFEEFHGFWLGSIWLLVPTWALAVAAVRPAERRATAAFRWIVLLFLCGVSWWCVMLQHTSVHAHVMRHALPFYALAMGVGLAAALWYAFGPRQSIWNRLAGTVVAAWIVVPHAAGAYSDIRAHLDADYESPYSWSVDRGEAKKLAEIAAALPPDSILLTNSNRPPLLRYWSNLPVYHANLAHEPFSRGEPLPGSHSKLGLAMAHLKDLYGEEMPRVVYVYFFTAGADRAYATDPLLWQLVDGTWNRPTTYAQFGNFQKLSMLGFGSSKSSVVAAGTDWMAFDATDLFSHPPAEDAGMAAPTRAELGPLW